VCPGDAHLDVATGGVMLTVHTHVIVVGLAAVALALGVVFR
jgi:hypothetical protein